MSDETVAGMREGIEARQVKLGLSPKQFAHAAGVTLEGLAPVRKGERRAYMARTRLGVARALRWPEDWYDRFVAGEDPASFPDEDWPTVDPNEVRFRSLEAEVAGLRSALHRVLDRLERPSA